MTTGLGDVLVVGGTGMLAPATGWIAQQAQLLTLVARHPQALAEQLGAHGVPLDWADPDAPEQIDELPAGFDLAVNWLHDEASAMARPFENLLKANARVIRVHGSKSMNPEGKAGREPDPRPGLRRQSVILGWHPDAGAEDGKRWLGDDEISGGVIAAIREPALEALIVGGSGG